MLSVFPVRKLGSGTEVEQPRPRTGADLVVGGAGIGVVCRVITPAPNFAV